MKYGMVCVGVLLLLGCSNAELEQEVAGLKAQQATLTAEKEDLAKQLTAKDADLAAQAEAQAAELAKVQASLTEAETALAARADYDTLKGQISDLKKQLKEAGEDTKKLAFLAKKMQGLKATMVTSQGTIELTFYPDVAPIHCFNFIARAESGFFNKTQFHRVIPGFMIQGGDPLTRDMNFNDDGMGMPAVAIPHEFNSKHHGRGILSMARQSDPRLGAGSQFFIMHGDSPNLDEQYTVFGEVASGMDVVDKIADVKRNRRDHPLEPVWIESVTIHR